MNTPTHFLISLGLLGKPEYKKANWLLLAGAVIPDLSIYVLALWAKFEGIPQQAVWGNIYWQEPWQLAGAISNSVPLYSALLAVGLWQRHHIWAKLLVLFALSCLLHMLFDFLFHAEDAHRHFWPLSDWRFYSPLSYWNPNHHGRWVGLAEMVMALGLVAVLWRRFTAKPMRIVLGALATLYITIPLVIVLFMRFGGGVYH